MAVTVIEVPSGQVAPRESCCGRRRAASAIITEFPDGGFVKPAHFFANASRTSCIRGTAPCHCAEKGSIQSCRSFYPTEPPARVEVVGGSKQRRGRWRAYESREAAEATEQFGGRRETNENELRKEPSGTGRGGTKCDGQEFRDELIAKP